MSKVILMVQAPDADASSPLPGRSGKHLAALTGVEFDKLGDVYERVNLFAEFPGDKFPIKDAKKATEAHKAALAGRTVLFVGKKIAAAFGQKDAEPFKFVQLGTTQEATYSAAMLPHPSRLNLFWNKPENVEAAKAFLSSLKSSVELAGG